MDLPRSDRTIRRIRALVLATLALMVVVPAGAILLALGLLYEPQPDSDTGEVAQFNNAAAAIGGAIVLVLGVPIAYHFARGRVAAGVAVTMAAIAAAMAATFAA
jgi:hypothetical protein